MVNCDCLLTLFDVERHTCFCFLPRAVALYKRAQILIADVWACCGGQGYGEFQDIDSITMFADYRFVTTTQK